MQDITVNAADLTQRVQQVLQAAGSSATEAQQVAANLVLANLSGHDSHGVGMLPRYVDAVLEGGLIPNASVKTLMDIGTLLSLDGQHGYGQVIGVQAMELGIARAKQHGSCIMTLANSHHLARIGHFAEMATAEGLVSLHFVNVISRPVVAPWGGGDGRFGTNPCCIGIPLTASRAALPAEGAPATSADPAAFDTGRTDFILDFATSRVAQGKMRVAHNKGQQVTPGLLIDAQGSPTTDPGVVVVPQGGAGLFGALMSFGEHKGSGLAVACELLGGALSGGPTLHRAANSSQAVINSMLTVLIDPARLGTQDSFARETSAFIAWVKQSPPGAGFDAVQIAGEPERAARLQRQRDGIAIDAGTWAELGKAAAKVNAEWKN